MRRRQSGKNQKSRLKRRTATTKRHLKQHPPLLRWPFLPFRSTHQTLHQVLPSRSSHQKQRALPLSQQQTRPRCLLHQSLDQTTTSTLIQTTNGTLISHASALISSPQLCSTRLSILVSHATSLTANPLNPRRPHSTRQTTPSLIRRPSPRTPTTHRHAQILFQQSKARPRLFTSGLGFPSRIKEPRKCIFLHARHAFYARGKEWEKG
jgi:hypothetical protein